MKFEKDNYYYMVHISGYFVITKVLTRGKEMINFEDIFVSEGLMDPIRWNSVEQDVPDYFDKIDKIDIRDYPEYLL
jgi:hypothetical protein